MTPSTHSERSGDALVAILIHGQEALAFIGGKNVVEFAEDRRTFHAVARCVESVSEASRRLSEEFKSDHPELPWRRIADTGNLYRHQYEDVAPRAVFKTATSDLPPLLRVIGAEIAALKA